MELIDGKKVATEVKTEIRREVEDIIARGCKRPHLAAILVGHDGGSETYVASKVKACEECGFKSTLIRHEADITEEQLLDDIARLNADDDVDGFIVQLPLPRHIDEQRVIEAIDPRKDVDGFHPINVGRMSIGLPCFVSATPSGIMELLRRYNIDTKGKRCVVLGRSNIVGKPMAMLMMQKTKPGNATVTVCHTKTVDVAGIARKADILVSAAGVLNSLTKDYVSENQIVIDVSINWDPEKINSKGGKGAIAGDAVFSEVEPIVGAITPVPGGVGSVTTSVLIGHVVEAAERTL